MVDPSGCAPINALGPCQCSTCKMERQAKEAYEAWLKRKKETATFSTLNKSNPVVSREILETTTITPQQAKEQWEALNDPQELKRGTTYDVGIGILIGLVGLIPGIGPVAIASGAAYTIIATEMRDVDNYRLKTAAEQNMSIVTTKTLVTYADGSTVVMWTTILE